MERKSINQGWRYFHCEDCEHRWRESSRDYRSPSGENCPRCGEWWFPYHSESDALLKIDSKGNLIENKMEIQTYIPETKTIDKTLLCNMIDALEAGLEYTQELLIKHDIALGRTTHSNKFVAEQMEEDIRKIKHCLNQIKNYQ